MFKYSYILIIFSVNIANSQVHNRVLKFNIGVSGEQFNIEKDIKAYNDTSTVSKFTQFSALPILTFSEEFTLNDRFSLSGTLGYQYYNIDYNTQNYGTHFIFASANAQLSVFYRAGFEYYVKLKVGVIHRVTNHDLIPEYTQRFFPNKWDVFTGATPIGVNFFFSNHWGANLEVSLWSPEVANLGLTYRFFKGEIPENYPEEGYYTE